MEKFDGNDIPQIEDSGSDGNQSRSPLTGEVLQPTDSPYPIRDESVNAVLTQMISSTARVVSQQQGLNLIIARQLDQSSTIDQERNKNIELQHLLSEQEKEIRQLSVEMETQKGRKVRNDIMSTLASVLIAIAFLPNTEQVAVKSWLLIGLACLLISFVLFGMLNSLGNGKKIK